MDRTNHQWRLACRPAGLPKESDFKWSEEPIGEPSAGQVLVRTLLISLDPTNRGWMRDMESYLPPVVLGEVIRGIGIGVVDGLDRTPAALNKLFDGSNRGKLMVRVSDR